MGTVPNPQHLVYFDLCHKHCAPFDTFWRNYSVLSFFTLSLRLRVTLRVCMLQRGVAWGWVEGWVEGWRDGGIEEWRDGGMDGWRGGGMEGWMDGGREGGMEG